MDADVVVVGAGLAGLVATCSSPTRAGRWCCSTRRARRTSGARRGGASAACSSSTAPNSAGWASPTPSSLAWQDWEGTADRPASASSHVATRPARPAPTTTTSASMDRPYAPATVGRAPPPRSPGATSPAPRGRPGARAPPRRRAEHEPGPGTRRRARRGGRRRHPRRLGSRPGRRRAGAHPRATGRATACRGRRRMP